MILDVGSGTLPLHEGLKTHQQVIRLDIWRGEKPVDIIADTHHLPFRDKVFEVVYASHVLEHTHHPLRVLREWKRVSKRAFIRVPFLNKYSYLNCQSSIFDHLYTWNYFSFSNLLKLVYDDVKLSIRINSLERFSFLRRAFIIFKRVVIQKKSDELVAKCS